VQALVQMAKEIAAFGVSALSVILGLSLVIAAFDLAVALNRQLWLLIPCLLVAALVPFFLVGIPRLIYRWRYGFPTVRRG
jgi:hypothetical protein